MQRLMLLRRGPRLLLVLLLLAGAHAPPPPGPAAMVMELDDPDVLRETAVGHAQAGDLRTALLLLRAACRRAPYSALARNDLGVTEMRLGLLELAHRHFQQALALDPHLELAHLNLEALFEGWRPPPRPDPAALLQRHTLRPLPRIPWADFRAGAAGNWSAAPFVVVGVPLRGAAPHHVQQQHQDVPDGGNVAPSPSSSPSPGPSWFSLAALEASFGAATVDFYPHNLDFEWIRPRFTSLAWALAWQRGTPVSEFPSYVQWNLDPETWHRLTADAPAALARLFNRPAAHQEDPTGTTGVPRTRRGDDAGPPSDPPTTQANVPDWQQSSGDGVAGEAPQEAPRETPQRVSQRKRRRRRVGSGHDVSSAIARDDLWLRQCLPQASLQHKFSVGTHYRMVLVGEPGAGMFNHKDTLRTASWQLQLAGRKRWHLCPPSQDPWMYEAGEVDAFAPDYARFPRFANASCFQDEVRPGEMLFYPADFWHQTRNLDSPTTAVTGSLVTLSNRLLVERELRRECSDNGARIMPHDPELCGALEACYARWRAEAAAADQAAITDTATPDAEL